LWHMRCGGQRRRDLLLFVRRESARGTFVPAL
jgi:hypothetical protein